MRIKKAIIYASVAVQMATSAQVFGIFQNLDFESANISGYDPGAPLVPVDLALPGWSAYYGSDQLSIICYDCASLSSSTISINDNQSPYSFISAIDGYSVSLEGRTFGGPASIAQTGTVPSNSLSVTFLLRNQYIGLFEVSFAGHVLPYAVTRAEPDFEVCAADISTYAGQSGELRFAESFGGRAIIDNIQFSSEAVPVVPEPGTVALIGLGAFVMVGRFAWRRS